MPKKMEFKPFQCQKRWSSAISTDGNRQGIIPLIIIYTLCINNVSAHLISITKTSHFIRVFLHYDKIGTKPLWGKVGFVKNRKVQKLALIISFPGIQK